MYIQSLLTIYRNTILKKKYRLDQSQYNVILHLDRIYKNFMIKKSNIKNNNMIFLKKMLFKFFDKKKIV
ncbi:MAG: hypothetical protein O5V64_647 [Wigglesworthia glossinidia]|nr:hypothetical protein [Wigglesworthia glossinidia]